MESWNGTIRALGERVGWMTAQSAGFVRPFFSLTMIGAAALALFLTLRSLSWPMAHDAPLMHYVAWLIRQGVVPYREIFDMNFPGTYLLHLLALVVFGHSDLGFRFFDLALLAVTAAGLLAAGRQFGRSAGLVAALLFWLYHLAGGAWQMGQRDFLLAPFLAWWIAFLLLNFRARHPRNMVLAGFCLGFALWIKPHAALLLFATLCFLLVTPGGGGVRSATPFLIGAVAPAVGVIGWLVWSGAAVAFFHLVREYLLPLYGSLGKTAFLQAIHWQSYAAPLWGGFALLVGLSLFQLIRGRLFDSRHAVLAIGLLYGIGHFFGQGKGWEYHLTPLALFASLLGAVGLDRLLLQRERWIQAVAVAAVGFLAVVLGLKGVEAADAHWYSAKHQRGVEIAEALRPLLRSDETVQVLDTTDGGVHALFLLRVRQPTRFLYDFHFYHDVDHPTVQALRTEFLNALNQRPPAYIVLLEQTWLVPGYERVTRWEALRRFLEERYTILREGSGFRIYAKRADS
jgi:hypothetical protein